MPVAPVPACQPEVAGSSPVAPVENILQIKVLCCRSWRRRPPVSNRPPARIPVAKSIREARRKLLETSVFCHRPRR